MPKRKKTKKKKEKKLNSIDDLVNESIQNSNKLTSEITKVVNKQQKTKRTKRLANKIKNLSKSKKRIFKKKLTEKLKRKQKRVKSGGKVAKTLGVLLGVVGAGVGTEVAGGHFGDTYLEGAHSEMFNDMDSGHGVGDSGVADGHISETEFSHWLETDVQGKQMAAQGMSDTDYEHYISNISTDGSLEIGDMKEFMHDYNIDGTGVDHQGHADLDAAVGLETPEHHDISREELVKAYYDGADVKPDDHIMMPTAQEGVGAVIGLAAGLGVAKEMGAFRGDDSSASARPNESIEVADSNPKPRRRQWARWKPERSSGGVASGLAKEAARGRWHGGHVPEYNPG